MDITLGDEYDALIITGPNTGGKTVTFQNSGPALRNGPMRLLIPADERSEVCVFDEFWWISAMNKEHRGKVCPPSLDTLYEKITGILELAVPRMVLLDELGAGHRPCRGCSSGSGDLEELRRRGCSADGYHPLCGLKVFALGTPA